MMNLRVEPTFMVMMTVFWAEGALSPDLCGNTGENHEWTFCLPRKGYVPQISPNDKDGRNGRDQVQESIRMVSKSKALGRFRRAVDQKLLEDGMGMFCTSHYIGRHMLLLAFQLPIFLQPQLEPPGMFQDPY